VVGRRVQQGPLPGQPQVQLRVRLRHPLMLSRIFDGAVMCTEDLRRFSR
jgi:hypothetical protein